MYRPIEILLADDHEIFRDGFKQMIKKISEITLTGEAANGEELLKMAHELQPDVIVTDIEMPVMDGVTVTRRLMEELPHIGIIALSMHNENYRIEEMIEAGASGYLVKNAHKDEIIAAIKAVYNDTNYYCKETTLKLSTPGNSHMPAISGIPEFSEREREIIRFICEENSNKEIAKLIDRSTRTVEWYREIISEKMHVKNTAGIVRYALQHKIYTPE